MTSSRITRRCVPCGAGLAADHSWSICGACQRRRRDGPLPVPSSFWRRGQLPDALAARNMGRVIAAYRTHPDHGDPIAQRVVAGWLGVAQSRLSQIENGPPIRDLDRLTNLATVFGIPQALLWFDIASTPRHAADTTTMAARELSLQVVDAAEESARFAAEASALSPHADECEHLRWELGRIAVDYVHAPLDTIVADLITARDTVIGLLQQRRHRPTATRELYRLGGTACLLLAHAAQNSGDTRSAFTQLRAAWTMGEVAEHDPLRAWIRGSAALIHEWSKHQSAAVTMADGGTRFACSTQSRSRLLALQARAAARAGDTARARAALSALHQLETRPVDVDDICELGGLLSFPAAKREVYLGSTYALLGDWHAAERHARTAITTYETGPADERSYGDEAIARVDVTAARLADRDLDGADTELAPLLQLSPDRRIHQLGLAVEHLRTRMDQAGLRADPGARPLYDCIADYLNGVHEPAPAPLRSRQ